MKKICLSLVLCFLCLFVLVGCSSYSGIEKRFLAADFEVVEISNNDTAQKVQKDFEEKDITAEIHVLKKDLSFAIIIEFSSSDEAQKQLSESETLKGLIKDANNSEFVNGNCVIIPVSITQFQNILDIFNDK